MSSFPGKSRSCHHHDCCWPCLATNISGLNEWEWGDLTTPPPPSAWGSSALSPPTQSVSQQHSLYLSFSLLTRKGEEKLLFCYSFYNFGDPSTWQGFVFGFYWQGRILRKLNLQLRDTSDQIKTILLRWQGRLLPSKELLFFCWKLHTHSYVWIVLLYWIVNFLYLEETCLSIIVQSTLT